MSAIIEIRNGVYKIRGQDTNLAGYRFTLVDQWRMGAEGGYVTVDGASVQPPNRGIPERKIRIRCASAEDYVLVSGSVPQAPVGDRSLEQIRVSDELVAHETDEEIIERLRGRFTVLKRYDCGS